MAEKLTERRKHKRNNVEEVYGSIYSLSDLNLTDISIGGMAIETVGRLDIDREYTFRVRDKDASINLKGCSVWSFLGQTEEKSTGSLIPLYRTGIKFTDLLDERANIVLNFIEENKMSTSERRLRGIRFKVANSENIKICYPYKYNVRKISFSGMEMEAEQPFTPGSRQDMELLLDNKVLNVRGRIIHCKEISSRNSVRYKMGIEFVEISDKESELLRSFLSNLQ
ncbi:MAG: PilZ domain-containing protein [Nitrospirota bacterium]